jgi:hypothetical protein
LLFHIHYIPYFKSFPKPVFPDLIVFNNFSEGWATREKASEKITNYPWQLITWTSILIDNQSIMG